MIEKSLVREGIYLLKFEEQEKLASAFLRFQEHYESPEFRGKFFTLDEYKKWYEGERGSFTYYSDWSGFNIPSHILAPFLEGKFDPLSDEEKVFLEHFKDISHPFYIIGLFGDINSDRAKTILQHETAHGLFYTKPDYKEKVLNVLKKYDLTMLKDWLRSLGGYHETVLDDESHAYTLFGSAKIKERIPVGMKEELDEIFQEFNTK